MRHGIRLTILTAVISLCIVVSALATNTVVIPSQEVYTGETGVVISIKLTNDVELNAIDMPLIIRTINPGSFITALTSSFGDRLPQAAGSPLSDIIVNNHYPSDDGNCKETQAGGFHTFGSVDFVSPDAVFLQRTKITAPGLAPGSDVTGSLILTVDVTTVEGAFEIDTTCTDPANHLWFLTAADTGFVPEFTKGIVTIINRPPVALCQTVAVSADANCEAIVTVDDVDAGSYDDDGVLAERRLEPTGPYSTGEHAVLLIVVDDDGDADTCQTLISVSDTTPPQVSCPPDTLLAVVGSACGATVSFTPTATDNCGVSSLTSTPPSGSFFPVGVTTVQCIATDDAGNADTCTFTITVADNASPWTVCNLNDNGYGSLRSAIDSANASSGSDIIEFAVAGDIQLNSALPELSDASGGTLVDGFSAPGASEMPYAATITLDGSGLGSGAGLRITSANNIVRGLRIINFPNDGVAVVGTSARFNTISANIIHSNGELAIDLGDDHLTPNDPGDADTGPNDLLNFPWPDSVFLVGQDSFYIAGATEIPASRVELFLSELYLGGDTLNDTSGHGEAWEYLGSSMSDGVTGHFVFPLVEVREWAAVTVTVTDPLGNTSEMSVNRRVVPDSLIIRAYSLSALLFVVAPDGQDSIGIDFVTKQTFNTYGDLARYDSLTDYGPGPDGTEGWPDEEIVITNLQPGGYQLRVGNESVGGGGTYFFGIRLDGTEEQYHAVTGAPSTEPIANDLPSSGDAVLYTYEPDTQFPCQCPRQGDFNGDGLLDSVDLNFEIAALFFNGGNPQDPGCSTTRGDFNNDTFPDSQDLNALIQYMFFNGPGPCDPCFPTQPSCAP